MEGVSGGGNNQVLQSPSVGVKKRPGSLSGSKLGKKVVAGGSKSVVRSVTEGLKNTEFGVYSESSENLWRLQSLVGQ